MLKLEQLKPILIMSYLCCVLVIICSGWGLLDVGIYQPFTPDEFIPGTISQDLVSLAVVLAFPYILHKCRQGSQKFIFLLMGLNAHLLYAYALYSFGGIYNWLFVPYIAIVGLTAFSLIYYLINCNWNSFTRKTFHKFPRKIIISYFLINTLVVVPLWLTMIFQAIAAQTKLQLSTVFVLDLGFVFPLFVFCIVELLLKKTTGYFLSGLLLIMAGVLCLSVFLGGCLQPFYGFPVDWLQLGIFFFISMGGLVLIWLYLPYLDRLETEKHLSIPNYPSPIT